jgi:hypothetical protein
MNTTPQPLDPAGDSGVTVRVGEREFSLREYQDLFAEITGGDSRLFKRFDRPAIIGIDDLKALYQKLYHSISNFHPVGQTCKVVLSHLDDDLQEFKSFEAFLGYDTSSQSSISTLTVEINFALRSPLDTKVTRAYSIKLFFVSQISGLKENEDEQIEIGLGSLSALFTINYADYAVALSCMGVCESWMKNLRLNEESKIHRFLFDYKRYFLFSFHLFFLLGSSTLFFVLFGRWILGSFDAAFAAQDAHRIAVFCAVIIAVILALNQATISITRSLSRMFEYLRAHSAIVMNKADERLMEWYERKRKRSFLTQACSLIAALIYAVLVKLIVENILFVGK